VEAALRVLDAAKAPLRYDEIEVGRAAYEQGITSGIPDEAWDTIRRNRIFLKGPITTPQGGGYKSLNVTIRKALSLFANVRPTKSYAPYTASQHPSMNLVIIRENEENLYAGHRGAVCGGRNGNSSKSGAAGPAHRFCRLVRRLQMKRGESRKRERFHR